MKRLFSFLLIFCFILYLLLLNICLFTDCLPTSLFGNNSSLTGNTGSLVVEQVDVARKLHEDPLLAIKKKEIEKREQLLKNPMKLKKLHDMVMIY